MFLYQKKKETRKRKAGLCNYENSCLLILLIAFIYFLFEIYYLVQVVNIVC